jgi:acyl carrier protein
MVTRKTTIKKLIIEKLNLQVSTDEISDDAILFANKEDGGVGLDSVDALEIAVGIMNEFEVEISDEDMHIFHSVETIDAFIEGCLQQS